MVLTTIIMTKATIKDKIEFLYLRFNTLVKAKINPNKKNAAMNHMILPSEVMVPLSI